VSADATTTAVGTWAPAIEVPCQTTPKSGQVCIPGGFFILGDLDAVGAGETTAYEPVPLHPTIVSPFLLDQYEFSVARFRALVGSGAFSGPMPMVATPTDPSNQFCTWAGPTDSSHDTLPLTCVPYATAKTLCQLLGGSLPTEAQWEYAARGRGQRRRYPWGDSEPQCCSSSLDRAGPPGIPTLCAGRGPEPVGSHPLSSSCTALVDGQLTPMGDVTRDRVEDMAGSVSEILSDTLDPFDSPCWTTQAILHDPACNDPSAPPDLRGAYWNAGLNRALLALRYSFTSDGAATVGFRCAYKDGGP
jgi:formylglycine-generating enzyme required for sulfatase activity